jgi:hypothetical protein
MNGIHLNLPFGLGELWLEWRELSVGLGHHWSDSRLDLELYCGKLQACYSRAGDRGLLADFLRKRARTNAGRG